MKTYKVWFIDGGSFLIAAEGWKMLSGNVEFMVGETRVAVFGLSQIAGFVELAYVA